MAVNDAPRLLAKSAFMAGMQCHKRLYLHRFAPNLRDPLSADDRLRMDDGSLVGELARRRFAGGVLIEAFDILEAIEATRQAIASGATVIYEACVGYGDLCARIDVLRRVSDAPFQPGLFDYFEDRWEIIEVKSSLSPEPGRTPRDQHLWDLAFQMHVARLSGLAVVEASLLLLNREYIYAGGEHDLKSLFVKVDVARQAGDIIPKVSQRIEAMRAALSMESPPNIEVGPHCKSPNRCPYYGHCHDSLPDDHIIYLPKVNASLLTRLREDGITAIGQVPSDAQLSDVQRRAVQAHIRGQIITERLTERLGSVKYPIHFLDFETVAFAVPFYPGTKPHDTIPVQWSDHVLYEDGVLDHKEFLHSSPDDPRAPFCLSLFEALNGAGSIVVYSDFEGRILRRLALWDETLGGQLFESFADRVFDLLEVLREHVYAKEFMGSFSLKDVLPALVPDLGYDDLNIRDGSSATAQYRRLIASDTPDNERAIIANDLREYCKRDTLAMVRLYQTLNDFIMDGE